MARQVQAERATGHERMEVYERRRGSRPRYESLMSLLEPGARPFLPLYSDFLQLDTVRPMWQGDDMVDDTLWKASLPDLIEELEEYRVELCLDARRVVLSATHGGDADDQQDEDEDAATAIGDPFFDRAASVLCCGFPGCSYLHRSMFSSTTLWRRISGGDGGSACAIGTLSEVLRHQHAHHPSGWTGPSSSGPTRGLVRLSLEVACAMSSLLELHHLDDSKARLIDLEKADMLTAGYRWLNSKRHKQLFSNWLELVSRFYINCMLAPILTDVYSSTTSSVKREKRRRSDNASTRPALHSVPSATLDVQRASASVAPQTKSRPPIDTCRTSNLDKCLPLAVPG